MNIKPAKTETDIPLRDPQCGKTVDPQNAPKLSWEGKTYHFCSESCRRKFEVDPPGDATF